MRLDNRSRGGWHSRSQGHGTSRRFRRVGWAALAVVALTAAGCSSSGSSGSSTTAPSGSNTIPAGLSTSSFTVDIGSTMSKLKPLTAVRDQGSQQPAGGGDPARHHVVHAVRQLRPPYLNDAFADAGYTQAQYRIDNAQGSDSTELNDATADINLGAKILVMDPLDGPDRRGDREARRVQGRHPDQLRPRHLPGLEHLLRQLRQRARGQADRPGLRCPAFTSWGISKPEGLRAERRRGHRPQRHLLRQRVTTRWSGARRPRRSARARPTA